MPTAVFRKAPQLASRPLQRGRHPKVIGSVDIEVRLCSFALRRHLHFLERLERVNPLGLGGINLLHPPLSLVPSWLSNIAAMTAWPG
jgi:hypothetical protein